MNKYLDLAVRIAGGQRPLARKLGISHNAVHKWVKSGVIPPAWCKDVSKHAEGLVSPRQLNPEAADRRIAGKA